MVAADMARAPATGRALATARGLAMDHALVMAPAMARAPATARALVMAPVPDITNAGDPKPVRTRMARPGLIILQGEFPCLPCRSWPAVSKGMAGLSCPGLGCREGAGSLPAPWDS